MKSQKVFFKVHGEFLTDFVRTLWADELEPVKALKILVEGLQNISQGTAIDVLTGKYKLVGVNELSLVPDGATESKYGNKLSIIEVMARVLAERERLKFEEMAQREAKMGHVTFTASPWGGGFLPETVLNKLRKGNIDWDDVRPYFETSRERDDRLCFETSREVNIENIEPHQLVSQAVRDHLEQILEFDVDKLEPDPELSSDNGWITPNGDFYPCPPAKHEELAEAMERKLKIKAKTCVRASMNVLSGWRHPISFDGRSVTQRQIDTIWDWCEKHNVEFPTDLPT